MGEEANQSYKNRLKLKTNESYIKSENMFNVSDFEWNKDQDHGIMRSRDYDVGNISNQISVVGQERTIYFIRDNIKYDSDGHPREMIYSASFRQKLFNLTFILPKQNNDIQISY